MKKIEELDALQIAQFLRMVISILKENEIILTQFISINLPREDLIEGLKNLSAEEVDHLLFFCQAFKIKEIFAGFELSTMTFKSILNWSSLLISLHSLSLQLNKLLIGNWLYRKN
jgi:hypothetical protein